MTEQAPTTATAAATPVSTNPYLVVVAKKSRNLHKKLDKILKADTQQKSGKALNEEQLILLTTRNSVEKQIADVDGIKTLLEEVAAAELSNASTENEQENKDKEKDIALAQMKELVDNSTNEVVACKDEIEQLKQQLKDVEAERVNSERVIQELTSTLAAAESKNAAPITSKAVISPDLQATLQVKINKLLKLFHVCARYPGARLPADVNFFGKCLMGETSISGFRETLQECTRKAELYLDDDLCSQFEASRGMTYLDISNLMDELATELGGPVTPPPEPSSPMINFFTDNDQFVDETFVLEEPVIPVSSGNNNKIEEHIDAVIEEAKSSLSVEDVSQKKKQRSKKPRSKKDNKEQATNSTSVEASAAPPATATPNSRPPTSNKPAWGGRVSGAHKESATASGTANTSTPSGSSGPNKGTRNNKGGAGRGAPGSKGGRSGRGAGGKNAPVPSSK